MAVGRLRRAAGDGPQTLRVRPMCTYVPIVVDAPTEGGAWGGGQAPQRGVRRRPWRPADRDRPRRPRERRIQTGRLVRQRLGSRAGCVSWKAVDVTANPSARPCPSPRLAPRQRASSRFLLVAPPRSLLYCAFPLAPLYYVAPVVRCRRGAASRGIEGATQGAQKVHDQRGAQSRARRNAGINKNAHDQQGGGASRASTRTCRAARSFRPSGSVVRTLDPSLLDCRLYWNSVSYSSRQTGATAVSPKLVPLIAGPYFP